MDTNSDSSPPRRGLASTVRSAWQTVGNASLLVTCGVLAVWAGLSLAGLRTADREAGAGPPPPREPARAVPLSFHVGPDGESTNPGTPSAPLDLATALSASSPARPGDTIWVGDGVYRGSFRSQLRGTALAPIVVRQWPGARAIIDATSSADSALFVEGAFTWFWGLEIRSGHPLRTSSQPHAADLQRGAGVTAHAPGAKFINLLVHDMKNGIEVWASAPDAEVYGNVIFNNGYAAEDRGHGHGIYAQNRFGTLRIADNVMFSGFSHGIHVYGSDAAYLDNVQLDGNIVFNSGQLSPFFERNLLLGGGRAAASPVVTANYTYYSSERRGGENNLGYAAGCSGLVARDNYWAHPRQYPLVIGANCTGVVENNVIIGFFSDDARARFPDNDVRGQDPSGLDVFVRPNRYESGRANVVVFNWDRARTVDVPLDGAGLRDGMRFEVTDAQNIFGGAVVSGVFAPGLVIALPMDGVEIAQPVGAAPLAAAHTGREFGAFIVRPLADQRRPPLD
ncbi:MAG: right-handed parallel beta-helix repeat-containing protein [Vicinamibacterales bacterium]